MNAAPPRLLYLPIDLAEAEALLRGLACLGRLRAGQKDDAELQAVRERLREFLQRESEGKQ